MHETFFYLIILYHIFLEILLQGHGVAPFSCALCTAAGMFNNAGGCHPEGVTLIQQAAPVTNPDDRSFLERR
jgi:hypothetical protein